jgi:hypothetical protein
MIWVNHQKSRKRENSVILSKANGPCVLPQLPPNPTRRENSVILSEASEYHRAAFGAMK